MKKKLLLVLTIICVLLTLSSCVTEVKKKVLTDNVFEDTNSLREIRKDFDAQYGLGEQIDIKAFDNITLKTSIYPSENSHKYLLIAYGLGSSKSFVNPIGLYFMQHGYNYITYDLRNHGNSGGLILGLGLWDSKDIQSVIDYIINTDPLAEIVVLGQSISGFGLLLASCELKENVKCMVVDSGFVNLREALENVSEHNASLILDIANGPVKLIYGTNLNEIDASESIKNNEIPLIYVVGDNDAFVSPSECQKIKDLICNDVPYKSIIVKGAPHVKSMEIDYENYISTIFDFCDSFVK